MTPGFAILVPLLALTGPSQAPAAIAPTDLHPLLELVANRLNGPEISKYGQTETEEDLDGENHVTSVRMTKSVQHLLPGGKQHGDVILAIEDGQDVTEKVRAFRAEREAKANQGREEPLPIDLDFHLPFEASQLDRYTFTRVGGTDAQPILQFEPREDRKRLWVGQARIDAATGTLLDLSGHPAVLPMFVDQIDVRLEFSPERPPGLMPAKVVIEGGAHFLFFHKRMRYTSVTSLPSGAAGALSALRR